MTDAPVPQTYANHSRLVPAFHFVILPILLAFALYVVQHTIRHFSIGGVALSAEAIALFLLAPVLRGMVITVQDRIIRLEMRLRLSELLPAELKAKAGALTKGQLIALRFASDAELPGLVGRVLGGELAKPDDIKRAITSWQGDYLRA